MKGIITLMVVCLLQQPVLPAASEQLPNEIYLEQISNTSCTLCASAMMVRTHLFQKNCENWETVRESDLQSAAWSDAGLLWQWTYETEDVAVTVQHETLSGLNEGELARILRLNPEGIVLYCGGDAHHGVFLTDYTDGIFYCADPAVGYSGKRIPLEDSLLGTRLGSQEYIVQSATAYWYICNR